MKYTDLAPLAPQCFGCRDPADGTLVLCHRNRNGWGMLFGKSEKALSLAGAIMCHDCHLYGDSEHGRKDSDWWEMAVQRTLTWAWSCGYIRFHKNGGDADAALR